MDIGYINSVLLHGKRVKEVREILGISEKKFQRKIKSLGFKFNQKEKQYLPVAEGVLDEICVTHEVLEASDSNDTLCNTTCSTTSNIPSNTLSNTISNTDMDNLNFIGENIELLKEMMMYYKRNKESNTNHNGIIIDLIDDKHKDNGKPKSVRVNHFIWEEWKDFTSNINFHDGTRTVGLPGSLYMDVMGRQILLKQFTSTASFFTYGKFPSFQFGCVYNFFLIEFMIFSAHQNERVFDNRYTDQLWGFNNSFHNRYVQFTSEQFLLNFSRIVNKRITIHMRVFRFHVRDYL